MSVIRTLLNNGFFVLLLLVGATLYLAYSDKIKEDHGLITPTEVAHTETTVTEEPAQLAPEATPEVTEEPKAEAVSEAPVVETTPSAEVAPETVATPEPEVAAPVTEVATTEPETAAPEATVATTPAAEDPAIEIPETEAAPSLPPMDESVLAQFKSAEEAIAAARQAFYEKDYVTAQKIYFPLAFKSQQADILGELANVLYADDKQDWAKKAWLESAKLLVKEGRLNDAMLLAQRLRPVAPQEAAEIAENLHKLHQAQVEQQRLAQQQAMEAKAQQEAALEAEQAKQREAEQQAQLKAQQDAQAQYQAQMKAQQEAQAQRQAQIKAQQEAYQQQMQARMHQANPNAPVMPTQEQQQARMQAYQQQMQAYQERLKAYYAAQAKHNQQPATQPQAAAPQMPAMPSQQEQQARMQAYQQQMQAYNERLRAYYEAQRQQANPNMPMPNGPQPFYPVQPR